MKIVVIDDELDITVIMKFYIERFIKKHQLDLEVLTFSHSHEALNYCLRNLSELELVICDLNMPGLCGDELLKSLRRADYKRHSMFITGATISSDLLNQLNVACLIEKPFRLEKLDGYFGILIPKGDELVG